MDKEIVLSRILTALKLIIFSSCLYTAFVMYLLGNVQWGNDILICAVLFVILNKLNNISN